MACGKHVVSVVLGITLYIMACGKHGAGLETDVEQKDVSHLLTIRRPYSVRIQVALNTVSNGKCLQAALSF